MTTSLSAMTLTCFLLLCAPQPTLAASAEEAAIVTLMKDMFDKPESPLNTGPVVTADDWAIADWNQGPMGGRALLKHTEKGWAIHLCGGDGLKDAGTLTKIGISERDAQALAADLAAAEARTDPTRLALFAKFEGLVSMDGTPVHGHK